MSNWTHPICELCWLATNPDREPYRLKLTELETCCWCGMETEGGIYVRHDPKLLMRCGGHQ